MKNSIFWIFGILQSLSLGFIIFLLLRSASLAAPEAAIGMDARIALSISFPLFLLIVEYIIYSSVKAVR